MVKKVLIIAFVVVVVAVLVVDVGIRIYSWVHADPRAIFHGDNAHTFRLVDGALSVGMIRSEVVDSLAKLGFDYVHLEDDGTELFATADESGRLVYRTVIVHCYFDDAGLLADHEAKVWLTGP